MWEQIQINNGDCPPKNNQCVEATVLNITHNGSGDNGSCNDSGGKGGVDGGRGNDDYSDVSPCSDIDCGGGSNSNSDSGGSDGNSDGSSGGDGNSDTDGDNSSNDCSGDGDSNGSSGGKSDSDGGDGNNDCRAHGNNLYEYRGQVQIYGIEDTYIQSTNIQITYIVFGGHQNTYIQIHFQVSDFFLGLA